MADNGLDGFGEQGAATAIAAHLPPVRNECRAATVGRMPYTIGGQRLAVALNRTGQATTQEALQFGEVRGPARVLILAPRLGLCHQPRYPPKRW